MKLHGLSIPFRIIETALRIGWLLIFGIFALTTLTDGVVTVVAVGGVIIGVLGVLAAWQIAYHRRYEYRLTADTFDIDAGVFSRREREIPYGRIQNVAINRNVFQRLFGIAEVRLETAGGNAAEARLRYVGIDRAYELQDALSDRTGNDSTDVEPTTAPDAAEEAHRQHPIFEITPRELAVLALVSLDYRVLVFSVIGVSAFLPQLGGRLFDSGVFTVPATVLGLYLLTAVLSALYAVTNYYDFTLSQGDRELRYERGLLQRYSGTIPLDKIQVLRISENVLARAVGYASVLVETAGYSPGESGGTQSAVPIAQRSRVDRLVEDLGFETVDEFVRPPRRARRRYALRYLGATLILTGIGYGLTQLTTMSYPWIFLLGGGFIAPIAAHLKWRHRGYAVTDTHIITRNGFWRQTTTVVPYHRIQVVFDSQTVFQRRWDIATLTIDTAGSRSLVADDSKAVDIDAGTAEQLRETLFDRCIAAIADHQIGRSTVMEGRPADR